MTKSLENLGTFDCSFVLHLVIGTTCHLQKLMWSHRCETALIGDALLGEELHHSDASTGSVFILLSLALTRA